MKNKLLKEINSREMEVLFPCTWRPKKKNPEATTQMPKHPSFCLWNVRTRQVTGKVTLPSYSKLTGGEWVGLWNHSAPFSKLA